MATDALERTDDDSEETVNLGGRPTVYQQAFNRQVTKLCRLGATDEDIAEFFQVSVITIQTWKRTKPRFLRAIQRGKMLSDANVAHKLYTRATGYNAPETKAFVIDDDIKTIALTKHIPADVGAAKLWLTNRRPDLWRDRSNVDITSNGQSISQLAAQAWAYGESLRVQTIEAEDAQALISAPTTE